MNELIQKIIGDPLASLLMIGNLILIESLLSVDNAAVLATMVMDLPEQMRNRALRFGIIGAYVFRGLCLVFASFLVQIWWLKPLGGLYLIYLVYDWWKGQQKKDSDEDESIDKSSNWLYKMTVGRIGNFWATVALVELMDLAFSMDNVFAAVALSDNLIIILIGVFIGILAMRFVAQGFVKLMEKYAFLEACAFTVIGLLGLKLIFSTFSHFFPEAPSSKFLESQQADWITSGITIAIFLLPIITSILFNFPKRSDGVKD